RRQPSARVDTSVRRCDFDLVIVANTETRGRLGMDFDAIPPNGPVDRIRNFLQPRNVGDASIEELWRRIGNERQGRIGWAKRYRRNRRGHVSKGDGGRWDVDIELA